MGHFIILQTKAGFSHHNKDHKEQILGSFLTMVIHLGQTIQQTRIPSFKSYKSYILQWNYKFMLMTSIKGFYLDILFQDIYILFDILLLVKSDQTPVNVSPHMGAKCVSKVPRMTLC